ncbi:hypothetical protein ES319_A11G283700v1 [Gossypium barbadense]|uniref:Sulfotransferase n=2 Tax=Gossypium TaxID=3633 RepID=A0A5J5TUJ7_GOSBA|nr:hypothetical protein ES319_A11G283700v1 [Gossypium barbadense]TYG95957.1 hypothetical protein ES288_A11G310000v1 [Gossypium darwinii]
MVRVRPMCFTFRALWNILMLFLKFWCSPIECIDRPCSRDPPEVMISIFWNCWGLGNSRTVLALRELVHSNKPGVVKEDLEHILFHCPLQQLFDKKWV